MPKHYLSAELITGIFWPDRANIYKNDKKKKTERKTLHGPSHLKETFHALDRHLSEGHIITENTKPYAETS